MASPVATPIVWLNGRLLPATEARISPFDQGLTIGLGAFETLVARDGQPFAFSRHWARLEKSCAGLGLAVPDRDEARDALIQVAAANRLPAARLRFTVTAGEGPPGAGRSDQPATTLLATAVPRPVWGETASVALLPWARHEHSPLAGLKTTSYAENALALAEARRRGADEALLPNTRGGLCEGSGSNVFLVRDGRLLTPPLASGCLAGVTRALVLELARTLGLAAEETVLPLAALNEAAEAFLTSTTRDIQPIRSIDGTALPAAPGPVTRQLQEKWRALFTHGPLDP